MSDTNKYACPYCGEPTTAVCKTISYPSCIVRYRRCLTCNEVHETTEIPLEMSKVWREAAAVLLNKMAAKIAKTDATETGGGCASGA